MTGAYLLFLSVISFFISEKLFQLLLLLLLFSNHNLWRAQSALIHYTRGPAELLTLKPDTGMLTHLPLGDSGTKLQDTLCPGH